jgi:hypothetical protein
VITKERQTQLQEDRKARYYKKKLEERTMELNTLKKRKRASDGHQRKSYGDFDDFFKKVR